MIDIDKIDYSGLPAHCQEGMRAYIEQRRSTGGFLYSILSADREMAIARADIINSHNIDNYFEFLKAQAPTGCWGSPEKVKDWLAGKSNV